MRTAADAEGQGSKSPRIVQDSKWDWWVIGGRWTGELDSDYDPRTDPRNLIPCDLCNGTGDKPGWVTYETEDGHPFDPFRSAMPIDPETLAEWGVTRKFKDDRAEKCNGCDACHGTGKRVKWSLEPFDGDAIPVRDIPDDTTPFAVVTPDGEWHERGHMGWWASVGDEKDREDWEKEVGAILSKYPDHIAVVVDCHI